MTVNDLIRAINQTSITTAKLALRQAYCRNDSVIRMVSANTVAGHHSDHYQLYDEDLPGQSDYYNLSDNYHDGMV